MVRFILNKNLRDYNFKDGRYYIATALRRVADVNDISIECDNLSEVNMVINDNLCIDLIKTVFVYHKDIDKFRDCEGYYSSLAVTEHDAEEPKSCEIIRPTKLEVLRSKVSSLVRCITYKAKWRTEMACVNIANKFLAFKDHIKHTKLDDNSEDNIGIDMSNLERRYNNNGNNETDA